MDTSRFQQMLSVMLRDPANLVYTTNQLVEAQNAAIRDYSRYLPLTRQYGYGSLYSAVVQGATTVSLVGGPFLSGCSITFEPFTIFQDGPYTLSAPVKGATNNLNTGQPVTYTLSAPTAFAHTAGSQVWQATPGLVLVQNQNSYAMAYDFLEPDLETLNIGLGLRSATKEYESFFDGLWRNSQRLSGVGFGMAQNFSGMGGLGSADGTFFNPQIGLMDTTDVAPGVYIFTDTTPVMLTFYAYPTLLGTIQFNYIAQHIPETVPDADMDALLNRAAYEAMMGQVAKLANTLDWKDDDVSQHPSETIKSITDAAKVFLGVYNDRIKRDPMVLSG